MLTIYQFVKLFKWPTIITNAKLVVILYGMLTCMSAYSQQSASSGKLQTWWHSNYELNESSLVADNKVRRSTHYDVKVSTTTDATKYDSFTYMSIPRSGKAKWGYSDEDGAEFAAEAKLTMSWSSFLYSEEAWVYVSETDGKTISSVNDVTIRPSSLNFVKELVDSKTVRIKVPYSPNGYRFSVEFNNQLYTAYNDMSGTSGRLNTNSGSKVTTEPRNALLIFAEPILTGEEANRLIPKSSDGSIYYPAEGEVSNLNNISESIVYFRPGTYYMPYNYHAMLPSNVKWVYLAPGAYIKGAFRFPHKNQSVYKVTGYGALSGEKYVYEADTLNGYTHSTTEKCHTNCVKMLQFESDNPQQYLDLQGVTIVEPPYHSFVVYGSEDTFQMRVENYKQVGSWFWQTDGIELYKNSTLSNSFFHANDDVLKMYHNNTSATNTVIWKNENGPVIQWGWIPRNLENVKVKDTYVIHSRMWWKDKKTNTCVINASSHWEDPNSTTRADPNTWVKNIMIENTYVEGEVNCAIRIYSLSSMENIHIKNLKIDAWTDMDSPGVISDFKRYSNGGGQKVSIGNESTQGKGLKLENYTVGGVYVTRAANNWAANQIGRLGFDADVFDNWNAWKSDTQSTSSASTSSMPGSSSSSSAGCISQVVNFAGIADQPTGSTVRVNATATSGLPIAFSILSGDAIVSGDMVTVGNQIGEVMVRALQAGDSAYCSASATRSFTVIDDALPPITSLWVAGTFSNWSLKAMNLNAGVFEFTQAFSAGNHALKFANTGDWKGKDWGNSTGLEGNATESTGGLPNVTFTITQPGNYKITLSPSTFAYKIAVIAVDPPVNPTSLWVAGSFNSWSLKAMAVNNNSGNFEYQISLGAGNHQLKFANTADWKGKDWGNSNGLEGFAKESTGGAPNISFSLAQAGDYKISFNPTTLSYSIVALAVQPLPMWVAGTFNGWSLKSMTYSSGKFSFSQALSAGNHQLKFANTGNWTGKDWGNTTGLAGTVTESTGGKPNLAFTVAQSKTYTITIDPVTLAYSIQ
ncbi:family 49 glycosyl hydrolase [Cellvibrio sp. UBA7671]|uniref:family 49 glycosyl hydrolase n=1 Tax=Cellvibrio sp. UBA7671 TaxID=1946312 RepID=UPI002F35B4BB